MTTPDTPARLTPAARVAALTALKAGLDDQLARAKADALAEAQAHGVKAFTTPWGPVNVQTPPEDIGVLDDRLIAWAEERHPDEVIVTLVTSSAAAAAALVWLAERHPDEPVRSSRSVRSSFRDALLSRCVIVRGEVVDTLTGEVLPWAYVTDEGAPFVQYPASNQQREAKALARMLFEDNAEQLTRGLLEVTS